MLGSARGDHVELVHVAIPDAVAVGKVSGPNPSAPIRKQKQRHLSPVREKAHGIMRVGMLGWFTESAPWFEVLRLTGLSHNSNLATLPRKKNAPAKAASQAQQRRAQEFCVQRPLDFTPEAEGAVEMRSSPLHDAIKQTWENVRLS